MRLPITIFAIIISMTLSSVGNAGTVVLKDSESIRVKYKVDGMNQIDTYLVEYAGYLDSGIWETGKASKPLEGHPIDNRKCHMKATTWIERNFYLVHPITKKHYVSDKYKKTIDSDVRQASSGPTYKLDRIDSWAGENCGKKRDEYSAKINSVRQSLIDNFPNIIGQDRKELFDQLKREFSAEKINLVSK